MILTKIVEKIPTKTLNSIYTFAFWCSVVYSLFGILWMFFMLGYVGPYVMETYFKDLFDFTKYKSW